MHRFDPDQLARLDSPMRRLLSPPKAFLKRLGLGTGDIFLDIGAGSGFFSIPAAGIVGSRGDVYAVDIQPEAIALIEGKAAERKLRNVHGVLSGEESLNLPEGIGGLALMYTVLHEVDDRLGMLRLIRRALRSGGRIAVVEFTEKASFGPPKSVRIDEGKMLSLLEEAGFEEPDFSKEGSSRYLATAQKP